MKERRGGSAWNVCQVWLEVQLLVYNHVFKRWAASLVDSKINVVGHDQQFFSMKQNKKCESILPRKGKYCFGKPVSVTYVCLYWPSHKMYFSCKLGFKNIFKDSRARFLVWALLAF